MWGLGGDLHAIEAGRNGDLDLHLHGLQYAHGLALLQDVTHLTGDVRVKRVLHQGVGMTLGLDGLLGQCRVPNWMRILGWGCLCLWQQQHQ